MLPELLAAAMMALYALATSVAVPDAADLAAPRALAISALPRAAFRSAERAVTNWRQQAALQLELGSVEAVQTFAGGALRGTSRCVRLNNYWCIKRAGWSGEIAADVDGHVAFATALDGAIVAALLLRRYYVTYERRSALAIVSRWAPAQCGGGSAIAKPLAPKGLANTLRARFLAGHARGGQKIAGRGGPSMRRTIIADRSLSLMPAPEIAVGMGERLTFVAPRRAAKPVDLSTLTVGAPLGLPPPAPTCGGDQQRLRAYATRAAEGIASSIDGDLNLFDATGAPGPNLARLMSNMARVEIGPLAVRTSLIAAAIDRAQRQLPATPTDAAPAPGG